MNIWESAGYWYVNDSGREFQFDTEQEARNYAMATEVSEKPIEAELAQRITGDLLPKLRELFAAMTTMQLAWQDNDMSDIIAGAAADGQLIAGFSPEVWATWGATFNALQAWLQTPNAAIDGLSPRTVLMKRYVAQG